MVQKHDNTRGMWMLNQMSFWVVVVLVALPLVLTLAPWSASGVSAEHRLSPSIQSDWRPAAATASSSSRWISGDALFTNPGTTPSLGAGKRGHYESGVFTGGISRISKISKFSRISRKWSDSPSFSTVWGFSRNSRISKFSRISRKWTFLKRPLFQKTPFSEPESPFWQLTRTMVWVSPGRKLGPWSEFPFLYRFTVLLKSGVVIFFFPYNPPPPTPTNPPLQPPPPYPDKHPARPTPKNLISVHFGSVWLRFGSVWLRLAPFRVCFGSVFGSVFGCWVGSGWGRGEGLL